MTAVDAERISRDRPQVILAKTIYGFRQTRTSALTDLLIRSQEFEEEHRWFSPFRCEAIAIWGIIALLCCDGRSRGVIAQPLHEFEVNLP